MIRLFLLLLIIILYFTFVLYNKEDLIVLKFALGLSTAPLPVYLLVLGSLIVGMFLAGLLVLPGWIRMRIELRRQRRTIEKMEEELTQMASRLPDTAGSQKSVYADELEEA